MRTTKQFAEYANSILAKHIRYDESYHSHYDDLIEERLNEIEPELLKLMPYENGVSRWFA